MQYSVSEEVSPSMEHVNKLKMTRKTFGAISLAHAIGTVRDLFSLMVRTYGREQGSLMANDTANNLWIVFASPDVLEVTIGRERWMQQTKTLD